MTTLLSKPGADPDPNESRGAGPADRSLLAPLVAAAVVIGLVTGFNIHRRLTRHPAPTNPMESIEVVEAWRSSRGMPVYEAPPDGHVTHFYGALMPWVQGEIFRWVGTNNVSGRVLTLVSALATITLIAAATRTGGSPLFVFVTWAALLGVNHRASQYFSENRPDLTAMFFATAGLILIGLGQERRRFGPVVLGSAALVVGFFFKQTASLVAMVPPLAMAMEFRRPSRREVMLAMVPLAVCSPGRPWRFGR